MRESTRFLTKSALFLLIPWLLAETSLRAFSGPDWFERADAEMRAGSLSYLFLGSSRTAAVDPATFENTIRREFSSSAHAMNLAMGYSTVAEYHLGLRWLLERRPEAFKNLTVFFGIQGGIPANDHWTDPWFHPDKPANLAPWLTGFSLKTLLVRPDLDLSSRAYFALGAFSKAIRSVQGIRGYLLDRTRAILLALSGKQRPSASTIDLPTAAGIRPDEAGLAVARAQAEQYAESLRNQHSIAAWDGIVSDTVRMLENAGARVVFFSEPMPPEMSEALSLPIATENRSRFSTLARTWNSTLLEPHIDASARDFPDGWHLRASLGPAYTDSLAAAYVRWLKGNSRRISD